MNGAPLVSALVPTVDHGQTLRYSVASALAQELEGELEVLIVGDGMPPEAEAVARELGQADERVRVFAFEKGPRNGEAHRDAVIRNEARGEYVLYLSDDDLWLPGHAAAMVAALTEADFAAASAALVRAADDIVVLPHDLGHSGYRALALSDERHWNHMPLSVAGHTIGAYRRLATGWSTSPPDIWSDLYFYRRFLAEDWVRARSVNDVTCLVFPSPNRRGVQPAERARELGQWAARLADPAAHREIEERVAAAYRAHAVGSEILFEQAHDYANRLERDIDYLGERVAALEQRLRTIEDSRAWRLRKQAIALRERALRAVGRG
jgi:glycosyltransferase involved in cell wall biosynthesis